MAGSASELILLMVVLFNVGCSSRTVDVLAVNLREEKRATDALEVVFLLTTAS